MATSFTCNVQTFGATGNGSTDDTAAIQAAINSVSISGGMVFLPAGSYKVTAALAWSSNNVTLVGEGVGATTIYSYITDGDVISVSNNSGGGIRDISIIAGSKQISGAGIKLTGTYNNRITGVLIGYGLYTGIAIAGGANQFNNHIDNFTISDCVFGILVGPDALVIQDTFITDGIIGSCTNSGIYLEHVSGLWCNNLDIISCGSGFTTYPGATQSVSALFLENVVCDTAVTNGWSFMSNGGRVEQVNMTNCWGSTCYGNGLTISSPCNAFAITNFRAINNKQRGIYIQGGTNIGIVNSQCLSNSMEGSGLYDGLSIDGGATSDFSIMGGKYGYVWQGAQFNWQRYGIFISSGNADNYSIIGANVVGNIVGGISDGGYGSTKYLYGNPGYAAPKSRFFSRIIRYIAG